MSTPNASAEGTGLPRVAEALLSLLGLVVLLPVLALVAILVRITSRGPALFRQERVGKDRRPFVLLKFRTMTSHASSAEPSDAGPLITSSVDPRITGLGALLRRTKLDELPQLLNILKGDLSFVGPRPEVAHYVDCSPRCQQLFDSTLRVRPGLVDPTSLLLFDEQGLLALAGSTDDERDTFYREHLLPFKLRTAIDYLERRSAISDLSLMLRTVATILFGRRGTVELEELLQRVRESR